MNIKIFLGALLVLIVTSCNRSNQEVESPVEHEEPKFQYIAYTDDFEVFAEADPFIVGETANVLSHFTILPVFKPIETGKITVVLSINAKEVRQTLEEPTRTGIYSFDLTPDTQGKGSLKFEIVNDNRSYEVVVPEVTVYASHDEAYEAAESVVVSTTNTTFFTKEQSWKIEFSTDYPKTEPFGQVIKTTALVESSPGNEIIVTAKTNGIVEMNTINMLVGREVTKGQALISISGNKLAENNFSVNFAEAQSNYEKAATDYERAKELAIDKIVSEKDLLVTKTIYDNSKARYDNLKSNFNESGQNVTSPINGFIKQVFVRNGSYVEAGQPLASVAQNNTLVLSADLPQKYAPVLANIQSANIRSSNNGELYTFEQLNGKVLSYGKAANSDNFLIPVSIQIDNNGNFMAGGFVEIYLKTLTNTQALTVANTALIEEQGSFYVWVQITPELFEKREILVGKTDGVSSEVVNGISAHERIVIQGAMLIKLAQATGTLDAESGHVH